MAIMTWAYIFLDGRVPGNMTAQMRANIGEDDDTGFVFAYGEYSIAGDRILPAVYLLARKTKKGGNPNRDFLDWSQRDPHIDRLFE